MTTMILFSLLWMLSHVAITAIHATSIPIDNAGFESDDPDCPPNTFWYYSDRWITGWTLYDPNSITTETSDHSDVGIANPQDGDLMNDPIYGSSAPEGNSVVYTLPDKNMGQGSFGIEQTLSATLAPYTSYTLTAKVGNPGIGCWTDSTVGSGLCWEELGSTGYIMQLLAGDAILAEDDNIIYLDDYNWGLTSVQFTTASTHSQLGTKLKIRLLQTNEQQTGAQMLFFDDVILDTVLLTTANPSSQPTANPTSQPTFAPITTRNPSNNPVSRNPSTYPTKIPLATTNPLRNPSSNPVSRNPSAYPTKTPLATSNPSQNPSNTPLSHDPNDDVMHEQEVNVTHLITAILVSVVIFLCICVVFGLIICVYRKYAIVQKHEASLGEQNELQLEGKQDAKDEPAKGSKLEISEQTPGVIVYNVKNIMHGSVQMTRGQTVEAEQKQELVEDIEDDTQYVKCEECEILLIRDIVEMEGLFVCDTCKDVNKMFEKDNNQSITPQETSY